MGSDVASKQFIPDELAIRRIIQDVFDSWSRGDAETNLPLADDVELVNSLGFWWRGASEVKQGLGGMNAAFKKSGGLMRPVGPSSMRLVTPDAAITIDTVFVSNLALTKRPDQTALISFFFVKRGGQWLITGGQTTGVSQEFQQHNPGGN